MTKLYQACQIKRRRRTAEQVATLERQIIEVLEIDHPQSIRHVFYRMTDPRLEEPVSKDDHGYQHVQYRITELRRSGRIPYGGSLMPRGAATTRIPSAAPVTFYAE